ncbi:DUF5996 family protein [Actinomadura parmotrematis]|uniref:Ava_C0101 and related proteins n=1 Tax=Actinomadura parmotrematis TaxID=2864039 RepID=A0ABS7FSH3_9ACTN|nr:DUF5996 family protein [Actinomadura parmotrematis]MBW8482517.1 hypothetical protein [Actinomadura parmotrematis]
MTADDAALRAEDTELFPEMPWEDWLPAKETFHRYVQIVGKVRLAASDRRNHWWNVPFHLTGRGITTRPMGGLGEGPLFCVDFDLVRHRLVVDRLDGRSEELPLEPGLSVAAFYTAFMDMLASLGVEVEIHAVPFDLADKTPFAEDTHHAHYDPAQINRYWRILSQVNRLLERYAADFTGKTSPVHHFWHTFDIAVTRFTGRKVPVPADADPVTREAYSQEVISAGFWFGDEDRPWPAFYSYTAPEPPGLADQRLWPDWASWLDSGSSHLAVLRYDDARTSDDPVETVLRFLDSAYDAGARLTACDERALACPGGVTDPYRKEDRVHDR